MMKLCSRIFLTGMLFLGLSQGASAFFVDGEGHYGLRGETRTAPAFSKSTGTYQAIQQSFRLQGEARFNDRSSAFLNFRLFPNLREAYLGDTVEPRECAPDTDDPNVHPGPGVNDECSGRPQNTGEPGYKDYNPRITKAFVRYAFDYCIVEAGRRGRDWGLGIFQDSGNDPFDTDASVYDGIDCKINIQKSQTLGFSVGFDKLGETGTYIDPDPKTHTDRRFGSNEPHDDVDQYYFTIEFNDRKANAGAPFTKHIGVYFSQISSSDEVDAGGTNTDLKFLDLYTGFFFTDLEIQNEILFRMGKSKDPAWARLGGKYWTQELEPETQKLQSIALAGSIDWTLSRSGASIGPVEYNRGDASRHVMFFEYAYAPGDEDGYYRDVPSIMDLSQDGDSGKVGNKKRNNKVEAIEMHRNFKPALLLFNARPESDDMREDGVFNPSRIVNAGLFGLGYRYESIQNGNFEVKLITASLNEAVPQDLKDFYDAKEAQADAAGDPTIDENGKRPAGFYGRSLGWELDLTYTYKVGREANMGLAAAAALPGDAWQVDTSSKPSNNFLLQSFITFNF